MHSERVSTTATDTSRKSSKPIMEKRRRARINASLAELKSLLLERIKKEGARHSKMEKADILEMTVKHLRQLQRQQFAGAIEDPAVLNKYRLGFNECATEVSRYLSSVEACDVELRARLLNHLANCMAGFGPSSPNTTGTSTVTSQVVPAPVRSVQLQVPVASQTVAAVPVAITSKPQTAAPEVNNNGVSVAISAATPALSTTKVLSGVQVVPTKLTSGEVAFVLPAHVLSSGQPPSYIIPVYASSSPATLTNSATIMSFASPAPANGLKPPQTVVSAPPPHHHLHYHHPPLQVMPDHSDLVASKNSLNLAPVLLPPMAATSTTTDNERPLAPNIANQQISEDPWRPWAH